MKILESFVSILEKLRINAIIRKYFSFNLRFSGIFLNYPPYNTKTHKYLISYQDPIRFLTITLAINNIIEEKIEGSFAELGVYRGDASKIIHKLAPNRKYYLFDTFEGFPSRFLKKKDLRFKDTNEIIVKKKIDDLSNIIIKKGIFPDTTKGLEKESFSFVLIDFDLFEPTLLALDFFYPKVHPGGYFFIHDYNNPYESNNAVFKAVKEFMKNKPEKIIQIPDKWGSIVFRKI